MKGLWSHSRAPLGSAESVSFSLVGFRVWGLGVEG